MKIDHQCFWITGKNLPQLLNKNKVENIKTTNTIVFSNSKTVKKGCE